MRPFVSLLVACAVTATAGLAGPASAHAETAPAHAGATSTHPSPASAPAASHRPAVARASAAASALGSALGSAGHRPAAHRGSAPALPASSSRPGLAPSAGSPAPAGTAWPAGASPTGYTALTPARVLDTRVGNGAAKAPLGQGGTLALQVTGRGGVPATGVDAVVLNLTVIAPTAGATYVTAYPTGTARPNASNLNVVRGQISSNLVIAKVGAGGRVSLYNNAGSTHLVADVTGYYSAASYFTPLAPQRILDTRTGNGAPRARLGQGGTLTLQVTGRGGVPAGATAVVLNLTAVGPTRPGFVTAYPGGTRPTASNLNLAPGLTSSVLVIATLDPDGTTTLYNNAGTVDLVADVQGAYADGGEYTPLLPTRLLDSRAADLGALGPGTYYDLPVTGYAGVAVTGVASVVLSVTAVTPTANSYLAVMPYTAAFVRPTTSTVNFAPGRTTANLVVATVGAGGWVRIYNNAGTTHLVVDLLGYSTKAATPDLAVGASELVTVSTDGATAEGLNPPSVSQDGRYVLFKSLDPTLVPYGSTDQALYVRDTGLGITSLLVTLGSHEVDPLALSADGTHVLWSTDAPVAAADTNGVTDIYLDDLTAGTSWLVSRNSAGTAAGNQVAPTAGMSDDGHYAVFQSWATDVLRAGTTPATQSIYVVDLASVSGPGAPVLSRVAECSYPDQGQVCIGARPVSDDGQWVTFAAQGASTGEVSLWHGTPGSAHAGSLTPASSGGGVAVGGCRSPSISADGQFLAFACDGVWPAGDTNGATDVVLRDRLASAPRLVSANAAGTAAGDGQSIGPFVSGDGNTVVFASAAHDLLPGQTLANGNRVFASPTAGGPTALVAPVAPVASDPWMTMPVASTTGAWVAYGSGVFVAGRWVWSVSLTRMS